MVLYTVLGVTRCYRVLHGVTGCYNVLHGVTRCYNVLHVVTECYSVLEGVKTAPHPRYKPTFKCIKFATLEITIVIFFAPPPPPSPPQNKIVHNRCFQFLLGRSAENNGYAKFWRGQKGYYGIF